MVEEIWQELAKARYTEWEQGAALRRRQQPALKEFCESLIKERHEKRVREVKEAGSSRIGGEHEDQPIVKMADESCEQEQMDAQQVRADQRRIELLSELDEDRQERLQVLADFFQKAQEHDLPAERRPLMLFGVRQIPEHLCCKITMDIFGDSVITPSGVTYERAVLYEHLRKVGKFDPLTRATLYLNQVVSNLALKEAVQAYLKEHGWAYRQGRATLGL